MIIDLTITVLTAVTLWIVYTNQAELREEFDGR